MIKTSESSTNYPERKPRYELGDLMRSRHLFSTIVFLVAVAWGQQGSLQTFHITPVKPVAELRREALSAQPPPQESRSFLKPDLVELITLDSTIKLDIRYATTNNFMSTPFYSQARAFLQRPTAEALVRVNHKLKPLGYGLIVYDGYRPWYVTKMFWDATPVDKKQYVADPKQGSRHNRGCAVDLSLYDLKSGQEVAMPSGYDEMSERSHPDYLGGTAEERERRDLLRRMMETEGFAVYQNEWWHFDYKDCARYPIMNVTFEQIGSRHFSPVRPPKSPSSALPRDEKSGRGSNGESRQTLRINRTDPALPGTDKCRLKVLPTAECSCG